MVGEILNIEGLAVSRLLMMRLVSYIRHVEFRVMEVSQICFSTKKFVD